MSCKSWKYKLKTLLWNSEVKKLKRDLRIKKRCIRNAAPSRRKRVIGEYVPAKEDYKRSIAEEDEPTGQSPITSGDMPRVDPPFTEAEVKNTLKSFHPRKASGIDGFTSDICQAAIFRNLELFLVMANKCLELRPNCQGDVGSESGGREDYINHSDRAFRPKRIVCLGTGDEEAQGAKEACRCSAQRCHQSIPSTSQSLPLFLRSSRGSARNEAVESKSSTSLRPLMQTNVFYVSSYHVR
ncbi:hypothetical protein EVAR_94527_1 [Eumeta japonica]|uniref:Uncharacterized protein n=1 Tax=Eumeta variegata TaxID=151549 RepID=A0A4C1UV97_EUMVA|nr:hypothetical protein EVAR_94527_1 [Eumeta japonica]